MPRREPDELFTHISPPLRQTFAFDDCPCAPTPPLRRMAAERPCGAGDGCPYGYQACDQLRAAAAAGHDSLGQILWSGFRVEYKVTLAEPTASLVPRSEHLFHGHEHYRFTIRKHLYEVLRAADRAGVGPACHPIAAADRFGEYLGFVDLRQKFDRIPLAMGLLGVPRSVREGRRFLVVTGVYGPFFGGPAFPCTVYSMHDEGTTGSACAQACLIMLLGMLSDRRVVVEGSYALTYLGNHGNPRGLPDRVRAELAALPDPPTEAFRPMGGLNIDAMDRALSRSRARTHRLTLTPEKVGYWLGIPVGRDPWAFTERLGLRLLQVYTRARYPVILLVHVKYWSRGRRTENEGHAVTIIGTTAETDPRPCLLAHDPGMQPYVERTAAEAFNAARKYPLPDPGITPVHPDDATGPKPRTTPAIEMISATPPGVNRTPLDCLAALAPFAAEVRFAAAHLAAAEPDWDLRFGLYYRNELPAYLAQRPVKPAQRDDVLRNFGLGADRYWVVAAFEGAELVRAWLFRVDRPSRFLSVECEWETRGAKLYWKVRASMFRPHRKPVPPGGAA